MHYMDDCHSAEQVFKVCFSKMVSLDVWFFMAIQESVKHIELVEHVNIVILTRWTFVCMTKGGIGKFM